MNNIIENLDTIPIDIVYAWCGENSRGICDHSGPQRHRDCKELQYSLRSVYKYASWVNHIYILVNTEDMQLPSWFNEESKKWITFIDRCLLFDKKEDTPTYNSFAVHTVIHKIPNLTNHFIYMDDDMFFNNIVQPSYFFEEKTMKPIIRIQREPKNIYDNIISPDHPTHKYTNLCHQPLAFRIDYIHQFNNKYPTYCTFIQSHCYRFQLLAEFTFLIYYEWAYHLDLIQIDTRINHFFQIPHVHQNDISSEFKQIYKILCTHPHIYLFNCNDDFSTDSTIFKQQITVLKQFYEKLYPEIPYFEYGNLSQKRLIIAGCAQNIQPYIHKVFQNIYKMIRFFKEYKIIIFENGSTDKTVEILSNYKNKDKNITLLSTREIPIPHHFHPLRIAYCRNRLLERIQQSYATYDYMVIMDLDDVCVAPIQINIFKEIFRNHEWDVVSFNKQPYYDLWALRYPPFMRNCWNFSRRVDAKQYQKQLDAHITALLKQYSMVPVVSAFCGLAIYKMSKIKNCYYDGRNREKPQGPFARNYQDCEHIFFHNAMIKKNGARIFISADILFNTPNTSLHLSTTKKTISMNNIIFR